jgi:dihydrofolate synthase/folylpolyglutamate synthase
VGLAAYRGELEWLLSFTDWERGVGWGRGAAVDERWNTGRTRAMLDLAGAPDRALRVVLIAGTKGKGSTAAMVESIARAAGLRTGLYTQPHFHSYRERIRVDGRLIDCPAFIAASRRCRVLVAEFMRRQPEAGEPTTFELFTVLAVLAFADARVDLAVVEVGLGGRLDATNALDPAMSVITTIGFDHTEILGDTLTLIAREKAGIMRPGRQVIAARQRPEARRALVECAAGVGAPIQFVAAPRGADRVTVRLRGKARSCALSLAGDHQRGNAGVAVRVAAELVKGGLAIDVDCATRALSTVRWPGRFEVARRAGTTFVLDAAHNPVSARALARTVRPMMGKSLPAWIIGMLREKDAEGFLREIRGVSGRVLVVRATGPRAMEPSRLVAAATRAAGLEARQVDSVEAALALATGFGSPLVVISGSFTVVAGARRALRLEGWDEP